MSTPQLELLGATHAAPPLAQRPAVQKGVDGQDDAAVHLPEATKADIRRVVLAMQRGDLCTTDSLRGRLSQASQDILNHPDHQNGLQGLLTRDFAKHGILRDTGRRVKSVRPSARGREIKLWERQ